MKLYFFDPRQFYVTSLNFFEWFWLVGKDILNASTSKMNLLKVYLISYWEFCMQVGSNLAKLHLKWIQGWFFSHRSANSWLTVMYAHICRAKPAKECWCVLSTESNPWISASVWMFRSTLAWKSKTTITKQGMKTKFSNLNRDKGVKGLTAAAVVKLCSVVRSDGWSFPATISSEPLKNLSKRFWVTLFTAFSGKWMVMVLRRGEETWL